MPKRELTKCQKIERSIITKYRSNIWKLVVRSCQNYELIKENDKIAVCISGGKDSMLLAKCMQELALHGDVKFEVVFICMNPGYDKVHIDNILENAKTLEIPLIMFDAPIFKYVTTQDNNPCYICARMRRGYLYEKAQSLGCNKIALGHHLDDVIETTLMSMFYSSEISSMRPKLKSKNFEGMELIRPLYLVKEHDIKLWKAYNNLTFINCACPLTKDGKCSSSKRLETKRVISYMKEFNPTVDDAIFRSIHNVNLQTLVGYRKGNKYLSFLENYDTEILEEEKNAI